MSWNKYETKPKRLTLRILSRIFDYLLAYLIFTFVLSFSSEFLDDVIYYVGLIASPILWAPLEALLISTLGTTPGKAVLGIHIRESDGRKLSFKRALKRSFYFLSFRWDTKHNITVYKPKRIVLRSILFTILSALIIMPLSMDDYADDSQELTMISRFTQEPIKMKWSEFKAPQGDFKIVFPSKPKEDSSIIGKPGTENALPVTEFTAEKGSKVKYSVSYTTLPHKWVKWGSGLVLKGALKLIANHLGDKIVWKNSQKYQKLPAIDYLLTSGNLEKHGKLVLVGHKLYKIEVTYPKGQKEATMHARHSFINSFEAKK